MTWPKNPRGHRLSWVNRCSSASVKQGRTWTTCGLQALPSSRSNGSPSEPEDDAPPAVNWRLPMIDPTVLAAEITGAVAFAAIVGTTVTTWLTLRHQRNAEDQR